MKIVSSFIEQSPLNNWVTSSTWFDINQVCIPHINFVSKLSVTVTWKILYCTVSAYIKKKATGS